jgi:chemotaxis protein MotA
MINILIALLLVYFAYLQLSDSVDLLTQLWQLDSFVLVLFGTLTATVLQFPLRQCYRMFHWVYVAFKPRPYRLKRDIEYICQLSDDYKQSGKMILNKELETNTNHFLTKTLSLIIDGVEPEIIKQSCLDTIVAIKNRHSSAIFFFEQMAKYAPGFGLLGTVVGLIQLLSSLNTPSELGRGMALALVTTFYGIMLSNLVFQPIAGRLYVLDRDEEQHNQMLMIGLMGIVEGLPSLLIKEQMLMVVNNRRMVFE